MNSTDHVWADEPAAAPQPSGNLWLSTLTDIVGQWWWLLALVVGAVIFTALFDTRHPGEDR